MESAGAVGRLPLNGRNNTMAPVAVVEDVGAGVDAAAGPVGREASGSAGWKASILSYSRAKGAYIGATLNGAELNQDHAKTKELYGSEVAFTGILDGDAHTTEPAAVEFVHTINRAVERAAR